MEPDMGIMTPPGNGCRIDFSEHCNYLRIKRNNIRQVLLVSWSSISRGTRTFTEIDATFGSDSFATISFTGSGGKKMAELTGGSFINEVIAQSTSVSALYNEIRTIIEMGGEDSKLIIRKRWGQISFQAFRLLPEQSLCSCTGSS
ncbi:MAG: hypothetical protein R2727_08135 [Bacteroidales bacterium]